MDEDEGLSNFVVNGVLGHRLSLEQHRVSSLQREKTRKGGREETGLEEEYEEYCVFHGEGDVGE